MVVPLANATVRPAAFDGMQLAPRNQRLKRDAGLRDARLRCPRVKGMKRCDVMIPIFRSADRLLLIA